MSTRRLIETLTHKWLHLAALIKEQEDLRKMVEELASNVDQSQDNLSTPRGEANTSILLELGDLRTKISRLTEQHTTLEGDVSFLKGLSEEVEELGKSDYRMEQPTPRSE